MLLRWAYIHDLFVFWLHGKLCGHEVRVDIEFWPPRPFCSSCCRRVGKERV